MMSQAAFNDFMSSREIRTPFLIKILSVDFHSTFREERNWFFGRDSWNYLVTFCKDDSFSRLSRSEFSDSTGGMDGG